MKEKTFSTSPVNKFLSQKMLDWISAYQFGHAAQLMQSSISQLKMKNSW